MRKLTGNVVPSFNLQDIQERMDRNKIVNPEDVRVAKERDNAKLRLKAAVDEADRTLAKLRGLFANENN